MKNFYLLLLLLSFLTVAAPFSLLAQKKKAVPVVLPGDKIKQQYKQNIPGVDLRLQRLRLNPAYKAAEDKMNREIMMATSNAAPLAADYILPVVFHIISNDPNAVTDQQMIDALNDLNMAFSENRSICRW
ncbi:MAG: hypothetical protein QM764_03180 [Chitinophagaceae bacterium]